MPNSKKMCGSSEDIISNLPTGAIDNILKCLSLRDAVRTSILSHRWKYKWANLPYLVFDSETFRGTSKKTHDELLVTIYEILLLYRGSIVGFVLSLPGLKSCPQIDRLLSFLSRNCGFKELTLDILEGDEPYKLPSSLFSCEELNSLSLEHCVIEPPIGFKGFNRLVSMEISECSILPDVLSGLISSCPLLQELKVTSFIPIEGHVEVSAPHLRSLHFTGQFASICFKYTPCLSSSVLWLPDNLVPNEEHSNASESLHNLLAVEHLELDYYYAGFNLVDGKSIPRKLTTTLSNLISLTLHRISFRLLDEVSLVLCLIRSSPNLTKIDILTVSPVGRDVGLEQIAHLLEVQEWSGVSLKSLRKVKVDDITGKAPELGFIELLLTISPALETMIVTSNVSLLAVPERFEILTKITRFRRSSPLAEIIYT